MRFQSYLSSVGEYCKSHISLCLVGILNKREHSSEFLYTFRNPVTMYKHDKFSFLSCNGSTQSSLRNNMMEHIELEVLMKRTGSSRNDKGARDRNDVQGFIIALHNLVALCIEHAQLEKPNHAYRIPPWGCKHKEGVD